MNTSIHSTRVRAPNDPIFAINVRPNTATNDVEIPNLLRRISTDNNDNQRIPNPIINHRKFSHIATLNTQTIRQPHQQLELANRFTHSNTDILGIIDHKIVHDVGSKKLIYHKKLPNCTLITQSAWRNRQNAASGGIGLLVNNSILSSLSDVKTVNERIMVATFNGNPEITVIVAYSPQEGTEEAPKHYEDLSSAIKDIPKHNLLLVMGDFNAHIGSNYALHTYHENTNKNGQLLIDLSLECNLSISNTTFQKKKGKLYTYVSDMSNVKSQVDFILINKEWIKSIKDISAYNFYASLGSDHRVLRAKIKISFRKHKSPRRSIFEWSLLKSNVDLQRRYSILVQNRYAELFNEEHDATQLYENLISANNIAAEELIPKKRNWNVTVPRRTQESFLKSFTMKHDFAKLCGTHLNK